MVGFGVSSFLSQCNVHAGRNRMHCMFFIEHIQHTQKCNTTNNRYQQQSWLASARQLSLCGATHITNPPDTAWTFALSSGMIIVFRLWCISGYLTKSILKATKEINVKLVTVQQARENAETRAARLESVIREQAKTSARNLGRNSGVSNSNSRSTSKRSAQDSRASRSPPDSGEQI
ncbi:hypothetical protein AHF37_12293 [Paragonimus kellicotti]|nr:hypothetical protein AHF37_12293 [Paragonimus kellicotti]